MAFQKVVQGPQAGAEGGSSSPRGAVGGITAGDVGLAAGNGRAVIFRKGVKSRVVAEADMFTALIEEVRAVAAEMQT